MKKTCLFLCLVISVNMFSQSVGIGTTSPNTSSVLELNSNNKGLLISRMGTGQRTGIINPAKGLMVYDTSSSSFWLYNGTVWDELQNTSSNAWQKNGNNIYNSNAGNTGIGRNSPAVKLDVLDSSTSNVARFAGGDNMWITLTEKNINRGYIGSYAGNPEDIDFGTYGSNTTGKLHLTIQDLPKLTVIPNGNVGIGTTTPGQTLEVNGGVKIGTTNTASAGSIRFNNGKFEGNDGTSWTKFDQLPSGTLVSSDTYPNTSLQNAGFHFKGAIHNLSLQQTVTGVAADTWLSTSTNTAINSYYRTGHTAVWTGTEMIIWGGYIPVANNFPNVYNTGERFNPSDNAWTDATSLINAPSPRYGHTAVWTGTEMIIWGGSATLQLLNTGAKYNPSTDTWTPISLTNAPSARSGHTAVWTGTEMIIWGGTGSAALNTGAKYNPSTDTWTPISLTNAPTARNSHSAIWTGTEMIIWGGTEGPNYFNTGAKYNPVTDTWIATSLTSAPVYAYKHSAIWTGTEMIIWGGLDPFQNALRYGYKYNPVTNVWAGITLANAPDWRYDHTAVWTGTEMIIWGGLYSSPYSYYNSGARYNPLSNTWTPLSVINTVSARTGHTAVWTGTEMIVYGGYNGTTSINTTVQTLNTGGRYFPVAQPSYITSLETTGSIYLYGKQ